MLILALAAGGVAWQAVRGSVSLGWLHGRIESAVRERLPPGARVEVGTSGFAWRSDRGLVFTADDIAIELPGAARIQAGELSVVATLGAFLERRIDLSSVALSDLDIAVAAPRLGSSGGSGADAIREVAREILSRITDADFLIRASGMDSIAVRDATLRFAGGGHPPLRIGEANWSPLGAGRSKTWLQVRQQNGEGWDVIVEQSRRDDGSATVTIDVEDLPVTAFAPALARTETGPFLEAPLTLQARLSGGPGGALTGIRAVVAAGRGQLSLTGKDRINLLGASLGLSLGPEGSRLAIPTGELRTGAGSILFEGFADLADISRATLVGRVKGGELPSADGRPPAKLTGGGVVMDIDTENIGVNIERLYLVTPFGTLSAAGQASLRGATPGLSLALSLGEMPSEVARAFWPPFIASKTRRWFDANVRSGTLGPASLRVALSPDFIGAKGKDRPLPGNALFGSVPFRDAEFSPLSKFPAIRGARGAIEFAEGLAVVRANSGVVPIEGRGELEAAGTTLIIPELGRDKVRGDLHLELAGPAAALAALSDTPPLSIAVKRGILADTLSGQAQLSLDANLPLYDNHGETISPSFRLALTDFSGTDPIEDRLIGNADLVLEGTARNFSVKGEGTFDGVEATLDLVLGSEAAGQKIITLSLDDAARENMGLALGGFVTGPIQVSLNQSEDERAHVSLDLKDARISLPFLGWEKGAGVPATAEFIMAESEEGRRISDIILAGKGFSAKGSLSVGKNGKLENLDLTEVALRSGDRLALAASRGEGGFNVKLSGRSLDARGIIQGIKGGVGDGGSDIEPIRLALDIGAVTGQNEVALRNVNGSVLITADGIQTASIRGQTGKSAPFEWTLGKQDGVRALRLSADDGGALIRFAGIYTRVAGGRLDLEYSGPLGKPGSGVLLMRDFRLRGEAALAPAVKVASRRAGDSGDRSPQEGSGDLNFTQLKAPFRQEGWVISIDEAALRGSLLGGTGSGTINIPGRKLAISGTFVPAFGLNNIAGSIPILGAILGGRDEGLVGITYKLFGPLEDPSLTMNPLSAIAPGIFRKIFEYR